MREKEQDRSIRMRGFDAPFYVVHGPHVAGVDEVGRGPLAGPVVAAAVILHPEDWPSALNDSKKMTPAKREKAFEEILACSVAISWACVSWQVIDQINIRQATLQAMREALAGLSVPARFVLVDGEAIPELECPQQKVIKGDASSAAIAAASVVAKVVRDRIMDEYDALYPDYQFSANKGYGTAAHMRAIQEKGPCPIHRLSFEPLKSLGQNACEGEAVYVMG